MKIYYPDGKIIDCTLEEYKEIEKSYNKSFSVDLSNIENTLNYILVNVEDFLKLQQYVLQKIEKGDIHFDMKAFPPQPTTTQPKQEQPKQEQPKQEQPKQEQPKEKHKQIKKSRNQGTRVLVMDENFEKKFITNSITEAHSRTGVSIPAIFRVIDKKKPCKGYVFKRYTDEDEELDKSLAYIQKTKNTI